ncbi:MAG: hypothetical protein ACKVHQ_14725, partial [Gammaproteobacteria bacterium]
DNVDYVVTLRNNDINGTDIPFDGTINPEKTVVTINPTSNFDALQKIYFGVSAGIADTSSNVVLSEGVVFETADVAVATFSPYQDQNKVPTNSNVTISFNKSVRNINDSALDDSNIDNLVILKINDLNGIDIPFDAIISPQKNLITIDPTTDFTSNQVVYA